MNEMERILHSAHEYFTQAIMLAQKERQQSLEAADHSLQAALPQVEEKLRAAEREYRGTCRRFQARKDEADRAAHASFDRLQRQRNLELKPCEERFTKLMQEAEAQRQAKISAAEARKESAQFVRSVIGKCGFVDTIVSECDEAIKVAWAEFDAYKRASRANYCARVDAVHRELDIELQRQLRANQAAFDAGVCEALVEWTKWTEMKKQMEEDRKQVESAVLDRWRKLTNLRASAWQTFAASVLAAANQLRAHLTEPPESLGNSDLR